jgi:Uri superfamily endonuclease
MKYPDITIPQGSGIYSLLLELKEDMCITVGALGDIKFPAGYYSYTGSARGSGGFGRIRRHLDVAAGRNPTRRWHIDYLLPHTIPKGVVLTHTYRDLECNISGTIGLHTKTIHRFGSSDCSCNGHLHLEKDIEKLVRIVTNAHGINGLFKNFIPFNNHV